MLFDIISIFSVVSDPCAVFFPFEVFAVYLPVLASPVQARGGAGSSQRRAQCNFQKCLTAEKVTKMPLFAMGKSAGYFLRRLNDLGVMQNGNIGFCLR